MTALSIPPRVKVEPAKNMTAVYVEHSASVSSATAACRLSPGSRGIGLIAQQSVEFFRIHSLHQRLDLSVVLSIIRIPAAHGLAGVLPNECPQVRLEPFALDAHRRCGAGVPS